MLSSGGPSNELAEKMQQTRFGCMVGFAGALHLDPTPLKHGGLLSSNAAVASAVERFLVKTDRLNIVFKCWYA